MSDAIDRIKLLLAGCPEGGNLLSFLPELETEEPRRPITARPAVASTFAASLELTKRQAAQIEQDGVFQDIHLRSPAPIGTASSERGTEI